MDPRSEKLRSAAYGALRASARRLLLFLEREIARQGGRAVTLHADEFAVVGSTRIVRPGLPELQGLGFIDLERFPKRYVISLSDRWRNVATAEQARSVSATARVQRPSVSA